jgi:hypothetical protein
MNGARLSLCGIFLTVILATAPAQTNGGSAPAPAGPVVMPPADQNALNTPPPAPTQAPSAATAAPATSPDDDTTPPPSAVPPAATPDATAPVAAPTQAGGAKQEEIYDIRPPLFFLRSWLWLWITLGVIAALALLIFLWRWWRGRSAPTPQSAYEMALAKLEKARGLMREEDPIPYAVSVSEAIRTYLGQRFLTPSTRRTTQEFLRQMQADTTAPLAAYHELLGEFLQSCDLVKFARYQPTLSELEQVQNRAFSFVTATKPAPAGQANGATA